MELDTCRCLWSFLSLLLFLNFSFASETNGKEDEVTSAFKTEATFHNYYAEGGGLQSNLSSISKRKVTARKKAPFNSTEDVTTAFRELETQKYILDSELSLGKGNKSKTSQGILEDIEDHKNNPKLPLFLNASNLKVASPTTNVSSQQSSSVTPVSVLSQQETLQIAAKASTPALVPKKKNKPDVTYDENDLPRDENGTLILPKEDLVESGPPFDYIVPIVIAMLTVPFLAVIGAFFYKKARDFWDRRHYRRMDFLIDGMYND